MDYQNLTMDATFNSGTRICGIMIRTGMDLIYESNEVFGVSLSVDASTNPRIRLGVQKTVRITDAQSKF